MRPALILLLLLQLFANTRSEPRAADYPTGALEPVPVIRQRPEWNRFTILVWQWQNDVRRDAALYRQANLHGFHIDRGAGEEALVRFSREQGFPYYVDHAAGKGILYLSNALRPQVTGKRTLLVRPRSLADPEVIAELKDQLRANVAITLKGLVYAYAFDDEISLGSFNTPAEVDVHPLSVTWYRNWLAQRYGSIDRLNQAWATSYPSFDCVQPVGFEEVRKSASAPPLSAWNLSRWMEWRHFMDYQFAQVLSGLTRFTNGLDPRIPAGFVGGQQPSAYGGYDYALLTRAVQWMEGSDELLRSFWNSPRRPHVQTYNLTGSAKKDAWTLWRRLAHGNQATIVWPQGWFTGDARTGTRELAAEVRLLAPVFKEIQGPASEFIVKPDTVLEADPIGIYYSQPSIRVGWAMDSIPHGSTWPNRSSSLDDENLSSGRLRLSWCKLLEDLGYQYDFISYLDVEEKRVDLSKRFKVLILPQTVCLSDVEAEALRSFVKAGGFLIADNLTGLLTGTGRGRKAGALDGLFRVTRDESRGYLDGKGLTEVDAEYGSQPYPRRLHAYEGSIHHGAMVVFERGTQVLIRNRPGSGRTLYLNLTPLAYEYFPYRSGQVGREWRELIGRELRAAGLQPRVQVLRNHEPVSWMETLLWRNGNRYCLALVMNQETEVEQAAFEIQVRLGFAATGVRNLRTGKVFGNTSSFADAFNPWEANLYEFSIKPNAAASVGGVIPRSFIQRGRRPQAALFRVPAS